MALWVLWTSGKGDCGEEGKALIGGLVIIPNPAGEAGPDAPTPQAASMLCSLRAMCSSLCAVAVMPGAVCQQ